MRRDADSRHSTKPGVVRLVGTHRHSLPGAATSASICAADITFGRTVEVLACVDHQTMAVVRQHGPGNSAAGAALLFAVQPPRSGSLVDRALMGCCAAHRACQSSGRTPIVGSILRRMLLWLAQAWMSVPSTLKCSPDSSPRLSAISSGVEQLGDGVVLDGADRGSLLKTEWFHTLSRWPG